LTGDSYRASGNQAKSPQPISANQHLLFWDWALARRKEHDMKISEEELLFLAIAGAAGECNFWKDMDDKEKTV